jgi:hypothetical protein
MCVIGSDTKDSFSVAKPPKPMSLSSAIESVSESIVLLKPDNPPKLEDSPSDNKGPRIENDLLYLNPSEI